MNSLSWLCILLFSLIHFVINSQCILRQKPETVVSQRQSNSGAPPSFPVPAAQENPNNILQPPSRELLPPLVSPPGPILSPSSSNPLPQSSSQSQRSPPPVQQPPKSETFELLPPVEIPPESPVDNLQTQAQDTQNNPVLFESTKVGPPRPRPPQFSFDNNQFTPNKGPQSSLIPTTGSGTGDPIINSIPVANFETNRRPTPPVFRTNPTAQPLPVRDNGLDCLGTCNCSGDFNFVCGNNRFLYQNDCALECDKRCHPDLVKVTIDNCQR